MTTQLTKERIAEYFSDTIEPDTKDIDITHAFWDGDTFESYEEFLNSGKPLSKDWEKIFKEFRYETIKGKTIRRKKRK